MDTESELPIAVEVTPAHVNDGDMGPALMNKAAEVSDIDIEFIMMDAGYDQLKNYEAAHELNAQAIIPLNLRNEKEPPTGYFPLTEHHAAPGVLIWYIGEQTNGT